MEQAQAGYTIVASCYETPREDVYKKYDEEKAKIFWAAKDLDDYHEKLAKLIDELGI